MLGGVVALVEVQLSPLPLRASAPLPVAAAAGVLGPSPALPAAAPAASHPPTLVEAGAGQAHPETTSDSGVAFARSAMATSSGASAVLGRSLPVRIDIPAINVHASVMAMDLAPDGSLGVPAPGPHYDDVAWYENSPSPGELGPSVIAGHLDSPRNGPSVFYRLGALAPGDLVRIARADGSTVTFTVIGLRQYPRRDFPPEVYADLDYPGLRLITCGGDLDPRTRHYLDNTVVYATLSDSTPAHSVDDGPTQSAG